MPGNEGDHSPHNLSISDETVRRWLSREGNQPAVLSEISKACIHWLFFHPRGLTLSALEGIAWKAMEEASASFRAHNLSVPEALAVLQQSLDRLSKLPPELLAEEPSGSWDAHKEIFDRDFWMTVTRLVERHLQGAFLVLSSRDQDLLSRAYGLEEAGDPEHGAIAPAFTSEEVEMEELARARTRLNVNLESLLATELRELGPMRKGDRLYHEAALRLIRGGKLSHVLTLLGAPRKS